MNKEPYGLNVNIPIELHHRTKIASAQNGQKIRNFVSEAIERHIAHTARQRLNQVAEASIAH